jgi:hypothetical protein
MADIGKKRVLTEFPRDGVSFGHQLTYLQLSPSCPGPSAKMAALLGAGALNSLLPKAVVLQGSMAKYAGPGWSEIVLKVLHGPCTKSSQ